MHFTTVTAGLLAIASQVAAQATHQVAVSDAQNSLKFIPDSLTGVAQGDTVVFTFMAGSHTVTESSFAKPCEFLAGGTDSGPQPADSSKGQMPQYSLTVNNVTAPLWYYCKTGTHCSKGGMVFSINPTADKSQEKFKANAVGGASASGSASGSAASTSATGSSGGYGGNGAITSSRNLGAVLLTAAGVAFGMML
ncbi:hypothetical protein DL96DRAFT_1611580 [Flagelloscypha sp. PMI_526]|nr:hypothetical protein DL96DRAFT_1611580 [Flagelloscypha sp. PMI_526]